MDSTFILNREELTIEFLEKIKSIFSKSSQLQITISDSEDFGLNNFETKEAYFKRLKDAANDVNKVSFTQNQFDEFVNQNLK